MAEKATPAEGTGSRVKEAREHVKAARDSMRMSWEELIPRGFIEHRREAHREMLLAMRSLLDAAIDRVDRKKSV
jgi:hypothetical protein